MYKSRFFCLLYLGRISVVKNTFLLFLAWLTVPSHLTSLQHVLQIAAMVVSKIFHSVVQ